MPDATVTATGLTSLLGANPLGGDGPAYRLLADRLRLLIADGRIPAGTRLPSERDLPTALGVSRTTVTRAYAVLRDGGYLTSRRGSGSVATLPGGALPTHGPLIARRTSPQTIDLTYAALPASTGTMQAYERALAALPRYLTVPGYDPVGLPETRAAIAGWYAARGLPTTPDQIIVTSGANGALAALAHAVGRPGQRVVMETPTYANAIHTLSGVGLRPTGVPLGAHGWEVESFEATMRRTRAPLAYLVPDFHNPTGALMSTATRSAIVDAADRAGTTLVVDETFADLSLDVSPADMHPPVAAFGERVVSIGSTSKAFWGGVRVGWLRLPADSPVRERVLYSRHCVDLGTPILEQLVTAELFAARDTIIEERRATLRTQRAAMVEALAAALPEWGFVVPAGGVNLWCDLPRAVASGLVRAAAPLGLHLAAGGRFAVGGGLESCLRLPYTLAPERLREAVSRLAQAWSSAVESAPADASWPPIVA
jgi:DNA-binding transcriptional MocR family regulator